MYTIDELNQVEVPKGCLSYKQITESLEEKLKSFTQEENVWTKLNMSKKGDVACGAICSPKIGLGVHWTYSYSRSVKFALTIVAFGKATNMIFTTDDVKIHSIKKGSEHSVEDLNQAIEEIFAEIADGVAKSKLTAFRKSIVDKTISFKEAYRHAADLYFDVKFLSPTQLSAYQSLLEPLKESESINMWGNFTCMNVALADGNPKTWLKDNRELSTLFKNECAKTPLVDASEELEKAALNYLKVSEETKKEEPKIEEGMPGEAGIKPTDVTAPVKIMSPQESKQKSEALTKEVVSVGNVDVTINTVNIDALKEDTAIEETSFETVEEYESELIEEVINEHEKTVTEEPAPIKKGLGLFSKLTEKVVSENTGKTKNVIIPPTMSQEQIDNVIEERNEKFNKSQQKSLFISDELTDEEVIQKVEIENVEEDESLIDDFEIPEAEDFEDIVDDEPVVEITLPTTEVDDFGDEIETESITNSEIDYNVTVLGKGKQPDQTVNSGSVTAYTFEDENLTVVVQK